MSHKSIRASIGCNLRDYGIYLLVYTVLLLHQEVDENPQNDALK